MGAEIELKLKIRSSEIKKLREHALLVSLPSKKQRLVSTYFDTSDLALHKKKIAVRIRQKKKQFLLAVKSAEPSTGGLAIRKEWEVPIASLVFDFDCVSDQVLKCFLEKRAGDLKAIFCTNILRQTWMVSMDNAVIELALDQGFIESCGKREPICELELELVSGDMSAIFVLARELQSALKLHPVIASKAEHGYQLYEAKPIEVFKARPLLLNPQAKPIEAFQKISLSCLEQYQRNECGFQDAESSEFVHQARVALRRLRSAIRFFAPLLPKDFVSVYNEIWRSLAQALGEVRDWDVFFNETLPPMQKNFPLAREVIRLHHAAKAKMKNKRQAFACLMESKAYSRTIVEFIAAVYVLTEENTPLLLEDFARKRIATYYRAANKLAHAYGKLNEGGRHRMRIRFKRLRYALDAMPFLAESLPKKVVRQFAALQTGLGLVNDLATAKALIPEVLGTKKAGVVHAWIAGREDLAIQLVGKALKAWQSSAEKIKL